MSAVSRCRFCGAYGQEGDRFCWSCGSDLRPIESRPQAPTAPPREEDLDVQLVLRRAFLARRRGDLAEAERLVREALTREPDNVSALGMLSEILRSTGDLVGAVDAAQKATEVAASRGDAPPGALRQAREERARIQQGVVDSVAEPDAPTGWNPLTLFTTTGVAWHQSGRFHLALAVAGLLGLLMALLSAFGGGTLGYVWFGVSLAAAGWCYHDAESRSESGLFWGSFVLCLGPFGLAIYLMTRY